MLGNAALAMWWNVDPADRAELAHWHAHEHVPERLALPGFLRASRWTDADGGDGGGGFFVLYELADLAVFTSDAYVARLNAPTPWSTRMMPLHRQMVRSTCQVVASRGPVTARHVLTVRLAFPAGPSPRALQAFDTLAAQVSGQPGTVGLHLLRHVPPALAPTTEQAIRGHADRAADWAVVVAGYDADALRALADGALGDAALQALGAMPESRRGLYTLAYAAIPPDLG